MSGREDETAVLFTLTLPVAADLVVRDGIRRVRRQYGCRSDADAMVRLVNLAALQAAREADEDLRGETTPQRRGPRRRP